eukprot:EG_transcript_17777
MMSSGRVAPLVLGGLCCLLAGTTAAWQAAYTAPVQTPTAVPMVAVRADAGAVQPQYLGATIMQASVPAESLGKAVPKASMAGLAAHLLLPLAAAVAGLAAYLVSAPAPRTPRVAPVDVALVAEKAPLAMAAVAGTRTLPTASACVWDAASLLRPVVTFEREVEARLLHGRFVLLAALAAPRLGATTASGHLPADAEWQYVQGLIFHSIFGLGAPEIAVIVITAGLLLGPKKLAELARDAGKVTGQLKDVTTEFQSAVQEGLKESQEVRTEPKPAPKAEPKPDAQPPTQPPAAP